MRAVACMQSETRRVPLKSSLRSSSFFYFFFFFFSRLALVLLGLVVLAAGQKLNKDMSFSKRCSSDNIDIVGVGDFLLHGRKQQFSFLCELKTSFVKVPFRLLHLAKALLFLCGLMYSPSSSRLTFSMETKKVQLQRVS